MCVCVLNFGTLSYAINSQFCVHTVGDVAPTVQSHKHMLAHQLVIST